MNWWQPNRLKEISKNWQYWMNPTHQPQPQDLQHLIWSQMSLLLPNPHVNHHQNQKRVIEYFIEIPKKLTLNCQKSFQKGLNESSSKKITEKPKETIGGKEIRGLHLCGEVSKNLRAVRVAIHYPVDKKGNLISVNAFLYFNSKVCKKLPKRLPMRKEITKMQKILVKFTSSALNLLLRASILIPYFFYLH